MGGQWYDGNIALPGCDKNMPGSDYPHQMQYFVDSSACMIPCGALARGNYSYEGHHSRHDYGHGSI